MNRWDIINKYIQKNGYKTYLEIGYYKGWSFDQVQCQWKTAVDPNPCKTPEQEDWPYASGTIMSMNGKYAVHKVDYHSIIAKLTSDEFFQAIDEDAKWDIIFIDGLHEASQVYKDIQNALKHLSDKGVIVLHDCNPPKYEHTTTGIDGCWTGDTYKAFIESRRNNPYYHFTVDTDWGIGVIIPAISTREVIPACDNWQQFDDNRKTLLNLVSVEEFNNMLL